MAGTLSQSVSAAFNFTSPDFRNITAVYWGQNAVYAVNKTTPLQYDLYTTCSNPAVDVVIISFVTSFYGKAGLPTINLSDQCGTYFLYDGTTNPKNTTDVLSCPQIGTQITQCQALGKKIFLSLGGATYTSTWTSAQAQDRANTIWAMFGPPSNNYPYRPFGNAIIDGYDLDFENTQNSANTAAFAAKMRTKFALLKSRQFYLTASPQCPSPDAVLNQALTTVSFDAVFIQFYNNACQITTWGATKAQTANNSFNLGMWQAWAKTSSFNKDIKLFIGVLATNLGAPTTGYLAKASVQKVVAASMSPSLYPNFGGVSFWDSSCANLNVPMIPGIRDVLTGALIIKRDAESASVQERDILTPIGGASTLPADDYIEVKAPEEVAVAQMIKNKRRMHHQHHRRNF
ncbi:Endochitinase [Arthrobotrys entomopaga]|nr:Endochitinase [Arthrobotrys entomopaga]